MRPGTLIDMPAAIYPVRSCGASGALAVREVGPTEAPKPRLLDRVRAAARLRHYSRRTEEAYVAWIRRYIVFHGNRHPADMGPGDHAFAEFARS